MMHHSAGMVMDILAKDGRQAAILQGMWAVIFGLPLLVSPERGDLAPYILPIIAFLPVMNLIALTLHYGLPHNWWAGWFGVVVVVDPIKHPELANEGKLWSEVGDWLSKTRCRPVYMPREYTHYLTACRFKFLRKRDAMMFKLAWG